MKRVVLNPTDRGSFHFQFVRLSGQPFVEHYKFGHKSVLCRGLSPAAASKSNAFLVPAFTSFLSAPGIPRTTASNHAAPATLPDDTARRKSACSGAAFPP